MILTPWEVVAVVLDTGGDQQKMSSTHVNAIETLDGRAVTIESRKTGTIATVADIVCGKETRSLVILIGIAIGLVTIVASGIDTGIETATLECIGMFRGCMTVSLGENTLFESGSGLLKFFVFLQSVRDGFVRLLTQV